MAHFSQIQSVVLAALGFCAIGGYRLAFKLAAKQQPSFEPFWVTVAPDWYTLCQDFGLYDVEKWKELQKKCSVAPVKYSIMRDGFNFTMLSPTLFYSNDHNSFFGELDFKLPVEELIPVQSKALRRRNRKSWSRRNTLRDWHGLTEEFANGVEVKHERKTVIVGSGGGTVDAGSFRRGGEPVLGNSGCDAQTRT